MGGWPASLVVLALVALAASGRISRWLPAVAAGLASAALVLTYAAVAFEVDYFQTPRPGLGILVSAVGTLVLAVVSRVADQSSLVDATAHRSLPTPDHHPAGSDHA